MENFGGYARIARSIYNVPPASNPTRPQGVSGGGATLPFADEKVLITDLQKYGDLSLFNFNAGVTSLRALTRPAVMRTFVCVQNISTSAVYVNFGGDASVGSGFLLGAAASAGTQGGAIFFDAWVPQGELYVIAASANSQIIVGFCDKAP